MPDDNEGAVEPLYCTSCDRRAAKPIAGPPFCVRCINKKYPPIFELPVDPYLRSCALMALGVK